jgi:hypothetical protein
MHEPRRIANTMNPVCPNGYTCKLFLIFVDVWLYTGHFVAGSDSTGITAPEDCLGQLGRMSLQEIQEEVSG